MHRPLFTKILYSLLLILFLWLVLRFLLPLGLPFFLAAVLAFSAEKGVSWMQQKLHFPRSLASGIGVSAVFLLFITVLVLLLAGLMRQLPRLADLIPQLEQAISAGRALLQEKLLHLAQRFPGSIGAVLQQWAEKLFSGSSAFLQPVLQSVPRMVSNAVGKLSEGMFGILTGLIAAFMLSGRLPALRSLVRRQLSAETARRCRATVQGLKNAFGGWLLAQGKLMAVTFAILAAGLLLLRTKNSLLWAALIALVDAFPVLGVGTVLLPWSLVCLLQGQYVRGIGLLAIYGVAWLSRSVLEPRWVGKGIGLDPLVTLGAIYAGFRLAGILGMLLSPILAMAAVQVWKCWQKPSISP